MDSNVIEQLGEKYRTTSDLPQSQRKGGQKASASSVTTPAAVSKNKFAFKKVDLSSAIVKPEDRSTELEALGSFRQEMAEQMQELVGFLRYVEGLTDTEKLGLKKKLDEVYGALAQHFAMEHPAGVTSLVLYAIEVIRTLPEPELETKDDREKAQEQVEETVNELIFRKFFVADDSVSDGAVRVFKTATVRVFSPEVLGVEGVSEALQVLRNKIGRIAAAKTQAYQVKEKRWAEDRERVRTLEGENPLTAEQIRNEVDGLRVIHLPDREDEKKKGVIHKGGDILISVLDGKLTILDLAGPIDRLVSKIKGVSFPASSLKGSRLESENEHAPLAFHLVRDGLKALEEADQRAKAVAEEAAAKTVRNEAFKAKVEEDRKVLEAKATLTSAEAHVQMKDGLFVQAGWAKFKFRPPGEKDKRGKQVEKDIWYPQSLVERKNGKIRVAELPSDRPELKEVYAPFLSFSNPGEDYSSLKVLGILLQHDARRAKSGLSEEEMAKHEHEAKKLQEEKVAVKAANEAAADQQVAEALNGGPLEEGTQVPSSKEAAEGKRQIEVAEERREKRSAPRASRASKEKKKK